MTPPRQPDLASSGEVLLEFRRLGALMKVSAVHVATNTEVCIGGPANAGEAVLKAAVLRRLNYVLAKGRA